MVVRILLPLLLLLHQGHGLLCSTHDLNRLEKCPSGLKHCHLESEQKEAGDWKVTSIGCSDCKLGCRSNGARRVECCCLGDNCNRNWEIARQAAQLAEFRERQPPLIVPASRPPPPIRMEPRHRCYSDREGLKNKETCPTALCYLYQFRGGREQEYGCGEKVCRKRAGCYREAGGELCCCEGDRCNGSELVEKMESRRGRMGKMVRRLVNWLLLQLVWIWGAVDF